MMSKVIRQYLARFWLVMALVAVTACGKSNTGKSASSSVAGNQDGIRVASPRAVAKNEVSYVLRQNVQSGRINDDPSTISTPLVQSGAALTTAFPLALPAVVPDEIIVSVTLKDVVGNLASYRVNGNIVKDEVTIRQIPEAAFVASGPDPVGQSEIRFFLQGLRPLLSDNERSVISVVLTLAKTHAVESSLDERKIHFTLQTPPSKLSSKLYFPYTKYEQEQKITLPGRFREIYLPDNSKLDLIAILQVRNDEVDAFNLGIPAQLIHEFNLLRTATSVSTSECSSSVSESVARTRQKSNLYLLPFVQNVEELAAKAMQDNKSTVRFDKNAFVQIGLYTNRADFFVVPQSNLVNLTVPTQCKATCIEGGEGDWADEGKWGGDCVACGRSPGNSGASCFSCMRNHSPWCRWQRWSSWVERTTVAVGIGFSLEVMPEDDKSFSEFSLSYGLDETVARKVHVLNEPIKITQ